MWEVILLAVVFVALVSIVFFGLLALDPRHDEGAAEHHRLDHDCPACGAKAGVPCRPTCLTQIAHSHSKEGYVIR